MRTSTRRAKWKVGAFVAVAIATLVAACGNSAPPVEGTANDITPDGSNLACASGHPQPGCACAPAGATAPCGVQKGQSGGYATCLEGTTTCIDGIWSACSGLTTMFRSLGPIGIHGPLGGEGVGSIRHPDGLGMNSDAGDAGDAGQTSCATPCDPTCGTFIDNSNGVDATAPLVPTDAGGWTLSGDGGGGLDASTQCFVTLTGKVYDPAALEPVFNAVIAVPFNGNPVGSGFPPAIATGVPITNSCGGAGFAALRAANTAVDGSFTLQGVPVQSTVALVSQIGRWRRQVTIDTSHCACGTTIDISDPSTGKCVNVPGQTAGTIPTCAGANNYNGTAACLTRLPRTQSEGNVPHIAIATGGLDPIECMIYRMGVSSSEYTDEYGTGRIHIFNDGGSQLGGGAANDDLSYLLGFSCGGGQCPSASNSTTNIQNPSFEGSLNNWTAGGAGPVSDSAAQHKLGSDSALLGSTTSKNTGVSSLSQAGILAPPGATGLKFYVNTTCDNSKSAGTDYFQATLLDTTSSTTQTAWGLGSANQGCTTTGGWSAVTFSVNAGDTYTLTLSNTDADSHNSYAYVDDLFWTPPLIPNLTNNYDMIVLPCDGGGEYNSRNWGSGNDDPGRVNLVNYANVGGRIFTSHWGREWVERPTSSGGLLPNGPFPNVATWVDDQAGNAALADIYTGGTWGANFNAWMTAVGAAAGGQFTVNPWREDTSSVSATNSRLFVYYDGNDNSGTTASYPADFTFDTPLGGTALGRVMFTDMHLATGNPWGTFPSNCTMGQGTTLTNQEAAAEYLLFDLGNCVAGQPVPGNYPPINTTSGGTNSGTTCSGGADIGVGSCATNADCEQDFHCANGTCLWNGQSGYYDSTCVDGMGNPGIDLTVGVPCAKPTAAYTCPGTGATLTQAFEIPICNRGGGTVPANTTIQLSDDGNGGHGAWNCVQNATPPSSGQADSCTFTLPSSLGPGECMDIDTTTTAGQGCCVLEQGQRDIYINSNKAVTECGPSFAGSGAGCMNNSAQTKANQGAGCPPACGGQTVYNQSGTFTRDFQGVCPAGYRVVWKNFSWSGVTPSDSSLDFQAWTADTQAQLGVQYAMSATLENPAPDSTANGYTNNTVYQTYVDVDLASAGYPTSGNNPNPPPAAFASHSWLRVNMTLNPSSNHLYAPTLLTWNQQYDCVPSE